MLEFLLSAKEMNEKQIRKIIVKTLNRYLEILKLLFKK
tara:strand:- start:782 stop:895 length:114 start_codon:yes stop_codon:yes gene_type:complete